MVIKASSARHIARLADELRSGDAVVREAAVARLTVIGSRALDRLGRIALDSNEPFIARAAALRAIEGIGEPRGLPVGIRSLADPSPEVAGAASGVVRTFLAGPHGLQALDALAAVVLDRSRPDAVRESVLRAMRDLDAAMLAPILEALLTDPSARVRAAAQGQPVVSGGDAIERQPAIDVWLERPGALPDDPERVRHAVAQQGDRASLPALQRLVERAREREHATSGPRRREWLAVRAAAHAALGARGSRLAIYDLREVLDGALEPLPVEFLTALTLIGDASCLEPAAGAYARAAAGWWRDRLADAFGAVVSRERVTRRHALARKIGKRWPEAFAALWPGRPATRPAPAGNLYQ